MSAYPVASLPSAFKYLAWSNLAAAAALVAVLLLGASVGETGLLQTA